MSMAERDADRMRGGLATGIQRAADAYASAQSDGGDRPDSPSMTKALAESWEAMEASVAELELAIREWRGGAEARAARVAELEAENAALKAEIERLEERTNP